MDSLILFLDLFFSKASLWLISQAILVPAHCILVFSVGSWVSPGPLLLRWLFPFGRPHVDRASRGLILEAGILQSVCVVLKSPDFLVFTFLPCTQIYLGNKTKQTCTLCCFMGLLLSSTPNSLTSNHTPPLHVTGQSVCLLNINATTSSSEHLFGFLLTSGQRYFVLS